MAGEHHDPFAPHVRNGENAAVTTGQEHRGGVLVDTGEGQQVLAMGIAGQHLGVADAKIGAPGQHLLYRAYSLATRPDLDIQADIGIEALGLGHVVAHELGLVQPAQLQDYPIGRVERALTGLEGGTGNEQ
ncbi:hypothetical protein D3C76_1114750 [compost metagenome]